MLSTTGQSTSISKTNSVDTSTSSYYENYEKYYWHYLNHGSETNPLQDLYQACQYLTLAASTGNGKARHLLRNIHSNTPMTYELSKATSMEFLARLQEVPSSLPYYTEVQTMAFMLEYAKRYHTVYSDYRVRLTELRSAFRSLIEAYTNSSSLNSAIKQFAEQMVLGFPNHVTKETLEAAAWKLLSLELRGEDPLAETVQAYIANQSNASSLKSDHPFRLLPRKELEMLWSQAPRKVACPFKDASAIAPIVYCSAKANHVYQLTISTEQLKNSSTICFFDKAKGLEMGRLKVTQEAIFFKAYGDTIHLKIQGTLDIPNLIVENPNADLSLVVDWQTKKPIYLAADVAHLNFKGRMEAISPIRIEVRGKLDFACESEANTCGNIGIRAKALCLRGKLRAENYCQLEVESTLEMVPESECFSDRGTVISAGSLKDIRGRIVSEEFIKMDAEDGIYLHGAAELHGKTKLIIKSKSILATDKASLKTNGQMQIDVRDQLVIDKESRWSAAILAAHTKTFKNYSPFVAAKKMTIRIEDQATNYPSGIIKTEESLQLSGGSVWNGGRLEYGQQLVIKLNKLFVHGIVYSSQLWELKKSVQQACLQGGDAVIIAGAAINLLGSMEVRNCSLSAIAEINIGYTHARSTKKSRLIALDFGIDVPNIAQISKDINRFCGTIERGEYQTAFNMICTWEGAMNVSSFARWTLRNLLPGFGQVVDAGWSAFIFLVSIKQFYEKCSALYEFHKKGDKVESSDMYSLLVSTSNLTTQAISLAPQLQSGYQEIQSVYEEITDYFSHLNSDSTTPVSGSQPLEILLPSLALDFATLFMPVSSDEAVFTARLGGFHSGATLLNRTKGEAVV